MKRATAEQLALFEPEGAEVLALLQSALADCEKHRKGVELMEFIEMPGAARIARQLLQQAEARALVFAILLDLEREAGL